jgi:hypothetical protein
MNWENLQSKLCPHCESVLDFGEAIGDDVICTSCTFHIARRRFDAIVEHRRKGYDAAVRMKWQYLLQGRCPIDQQMLRPIPGKHIHNGAQMCSNADCPFKIKDSLLKEIMTDPEHPANRFAGKT